MEHIWWWNGVRGLQVPKPEYLSKEFVVVLVVVVVA